MENEYINKQKIIKLKPIRKCIKCSKPTKSEISMTYKYNGEEYCADCYFKITGEYTCCECGEQWLDYDYYKYNDKIYCEICVEKKEENGENIEDYIKLLDNAT